MFEGLGGCRYKEGKWLRVQVETTRKERESQRKDSEIQSDDRQTDRQTDEKKTAALQTY